MGTSKLHPQTVTTDFADPLNHKGERLFTGSLAVAYGVRELESRVGCFYCDASIVMTAIPPTFQKYFCRKVSEDLLDNTERIIVDELVCT